MASMKIKFANLPSSSLGNSFGTFFSIGSLDKGDQ